MDHLADGTAKMSQGRENWYIGREGVPVDDSSGGKCEPVIVFECMDLSIGQRVNVSGLSCVSSKVLRCPNTSSKVYFLCGVGPRGASLTPST